MIKLAQIIDVVPPDPSSTNENLQLRVRIIPTDEFTVVNYPLTKSSKYPSTDSIILIYQPNDYLSYYVTTLRENDVEIGDLELFDTTTLNGKNLLEEDEYAWRVGNKTTNTSTLILKKAFIDASVSTSLGKSKFNLGATQTLIDSRLITLKGQALIGNFLEMPLSTSTFQNSTGGVNFSYTYGTNLVKCDFNIDKSGVNIKVNTPLGSGNINLKTDGCEVTFNNSKITINRLGEVTIDAQSIKMGKNVKKLLTEDFVDKFNNHTHPSSSGPTSPPTTPIVFAEVTTQITQAG